MFATIAFLWNASRGNHFTPWRSDYVRWRIETYSGLQAEAIGPRLFFQFLLRERGRLLRFLLWTAKMRKIASK
jgi:hypothetical protein